MKINKIAIYNFKGLRTAEFLPTQFACLVGENNAGKSSVLQAIAFALNRPNQLGHEVFYDTTQPVEFHIELSDVTERHLMRLAEEHRGRISELVVDQCLRIIVRYREGQRVEVRVVRWVPTKAEYREEHISHILSGKKGSAVRQAIVANYPEFSADCPVDLNSTNAKKYIASQISKLPRDQLIPEEAPLPSGIGPSITALLPEPIYIPAVKNLADDLKTSQSTSFGRLLGLLLEDMSPDLAAIRQSLNELNNLFNRTERDGVIVDTRHSRVRALESDVEGLLKENFPDVKIELKIPPPELKTILNATQM